MEERSWARTKAWASGQKVRSCTIATIATVLARAAARRLHLVLSVSNALDLPSAPFN